MSKNESEAYNMRGLITILIGEIFVLMQWNVVIGSIWVDIIPDFVGYIIIIFGITKMIPFDSKFKAARIFATILLGLSIVYMVVLADVNNIEENAAFAGFILSISIVFELVMMYFIIFACASIAKECGIVRLAKFHKAAFVYIAIIRIIGFAAGFGSALTGFELLKLLVVIMQFVAIVSFVFLLARTYMDLDGKLSNSK